ncbi:MSMEG_6728 family protein [Nocardioides sp. CER19]|uniref:MSMEG_6728 family protein n=1 Tax=Nocardioides sp. CER19 TaxID=3038538 RepID=UPI002447F5E7|nr:MSMEG_6728 family protein [Nocardioides sp. CER19]MDH2413184.1 MSMEG_6728 family protein [Nocardioides sp. CER19]
MQTFLPYADFARTMEVLDRKRLGKQRVECIQIVRGLVRPDYAWRHHPAVKMWAGCLEALGAYGLASTRAWAAAGFADTCADTIRADLATAGVTTVREQAELAEAGELPLWLGDEAFHRSHQSSLLRKDPDHYGPLFPGVPDDLPYIWPPGRGAGGPQG